MQSRHVLPAWFGVGFALERFVGDSSERERLLQTNDGAVSVLRRSDQ